MNLPMIFRLLVFSLEASSLGLYLKDLLRLVVQLKRFLMILIMIRLVQLDLFASCLAKRHKRKRFREAARNEFRFLFLLLLCLDVCYYCSNIIVSLFFSFVQSYSLL